MVLAPLRTHEAMQHFLSNFLQQKVQIDLRNQSCVRVRVTLLLQIMTIVDLPGKADAAILKDNMEAFVPFDLENDPVLADAGISDVAATVRSTRGLCAFAENRRLAEAPGQGTESAATRFMHPFIILYTYIMAHRDTN